MKKFLKNLILVFIFFFSNQNIAYGEKYLEVLKLYDLYSQEILDIDQLNSSLEKMNLNSENKQAIHDVLIADMQKRLYEDGKGIMFTNDNEYTMMLETLVETILHTSSIADVNDVLIEYGELFPNEYLTLDGTLNYVIALLAK